MICFAFHWRIFIPFASEYSTSSPLDHIHVERILLESILIKLSPEEMENNSWEPYVDLRDSDQLHVFLRQNNLLRLIPKKFR